MNVAGTSTNSVNVLPMFGELESHMLDPMEELLREAYIEDEDSEILAERRCDLVLETHFPDQSMYVLDKQIQLLKQKLERIKFYLGDLDSLLPDKNL